MPCTAPECLENKADVRNACEVCKLVDGDSSIKRVKHCKVCKAYICADHWDDVMNRGLAAVLNVVEKLDEAIKSAVKRAKSKKK